MKIRWVLLLVPLVAALGCGQAPQEVTVGQTLSARALTNFLVNDAKIDNVVVDMWKGQRQRQIAAKATNVAHAAVAKFGLPRTPTDKDGKATGPAVVTLTGPQSTELAAAIVANVQKANRDTDTVLGKLKIARDLNAKNLTQYAQLQGALNDYLAAGIDSAVLGELADYLVETIPNVIGKDE